MKIIYAAVIVFMFALAKPASATTLQECDDMGSKQCSVVQTNYIIRMTNDLNKTNPKLARAIIDYFNVVESGHTLPQGIEDVYVQQRTVSELAKQGKADKSKVQVESLILYVVKQKFMQPQTASR